MVKWVIVAVVVMGTLGAGPATRPTALRSPEYARALAEFRKAEIPRVEASIAADRKAMADVRTGRVKTRFSVQETLQHWQRRIQDQEKWLGILKAGGPDKLYMLDKEPEVGMVGYMLPMLIVEVTGDNEAIVKAGIEKNTEERDPYGVPQRVADSFKFDAVLSGFSTADKVEGRFWTVDVPLKITGIRRSGGRSLFVLEPLK